MRQVANFQEEALLWARGYRRIAGLDEVGRGPIAGVLTAAAVILPPPPHPPWMRKVRDSKQVTARVREYLFSCLQGYAQASGIGHVTPQEVDDLGITEACRLAMTRALEQIQPAPDFLLIDFLDLPHLSILQRPIPGGDATCLSIAAASIVAKVTRDRLMEELDGLYPGYGFACHKGYATRAHLHNLELLGPCPLHRRSFAPVGRLLGRNGYAP